MTGTTRGHVYGCPSDVVRAAAMGREVEAKLLPGAKRKVYNGVTRDGGYRMERDRGLTDSAPATAEECDEWGDQEIGKIVRLVCLGDCTVTDAAEAMGLGMDTHAISRLLKAIWLGEEKRRKYTISKMGKAKELADRPIVDHETNSGVES